MSITNDSTEIEVSDRARAVELTQGAKHEMALADAAWDSAVHHALRAGDRLIEAKSLVKHGQWTKWLRENGISPRMAQNHMRLAANRQRVADLGSVREAIALISKTQRVSFLEGSEPKADEDLAPEAEAVMAEVNDCGETIARMLSLGLKLDTAYRLSEVGPVERALLTKFSLMWPSWKTLPQRWDVPA